MDSICSGTPVGPWFDGGFTLCFIDFYLIGFLTLYIIISGLFRIFQSRRIIKNDNVDSAKLLKTKIVLCVLLIVMSLVYILIRFAMSDAPVYAVLSEAFNCINWTICLYIIILENNKSLFHNWVLKLFWILCFMVSAVRLQTMFTLWKENNKTFLDVYHIIRMLIYAVVTTIGLFINTEVDKLKEYQQLKESESTSLLEGDHHVNRERHTANPEKKSNIFSRMIFGFANSIMKLGYQKSLSQDDLWNLNDEDQAEKLADDFERAWTREKQSNNPSLIRAVFRFLGLPFAFIGILKFISDGCVLLGPILLNFAILFIKDSSYPMYYGLLIALGLFVSGSLSTLCMQNYWYFTLKMGQRVRSALITCIYRKCFNITSKSKQTYTTGEIVNYMSIDSNVFNFLIADLHFVWTSPIQISLSLYLLYRQVGYAVFAGLFVLLLMIPLNTLLAKKMIALQGIVMENKDKRVKVINEVLQGIRIIKFFTWESSYTQKVNEIREVELKTLKRVAYINAFANFTWTSVPILVSISTFLVFSLQGKVLTSEIAFTSLSLFNMLRVPIYFIPEVIKEIVEAVISTRRITKYLLIDERDPNNVNWNKNSVNDNVSVEIQDGSFTWDQERAALKNINLKVQKGEFVAIVGSVGAGKSSLLSCLIGDMEKQSGTVNINGTVSYSSQQAWIQNCSAKDNILFGKKFDQKHYDKTVKVCQLKKDFEIMTAGDQTEIGEKGINLSGGQKQRISIARATYQDSDVYLLDDILSAVDVHVGKKIFDECLMKMLKNKTRVLVTHQLQYLPPVDRIYVLKDGVIIESGKFEELVKKEGEFSRLISSLNEHEKKGSSTDISESKELEIENEEVVKPQKESKIIVEEEKQYGNLSSQVYKNYFIAIGGLFLSFLIAFIFFLSMIMRISGDFWLSYWSNNVTGEHGVTYYLSIYSFLGFGFCILMLGNTIGIMYSGIVASKKLHSSLLNVILRAPTSFFDTNPTGRILNRFSKDIYSVDETLPNAWGGMLNTLFNGIGVIIVISIVTPLFLIFWFPLAALYRLVQKYFIASSRELKRLDSVSRSPIYNHFTETLNGLTVIRSFDATERFVHENKEKIDKNVQANFLYFTVNRWLGTRLEFMGTCVVTFACLFAVIERNTIDPGLAGLSLVYSLQLTGILNWLVRTISETETEMVSVERISEYLDTEQELPSHIPQNKPHDSWPHQGAIKFKNYKLRYRKGLDLVLKGINVSISSNEKVGIVGRTGAGKSSLIMALFRFIEPAGGSIEIDGVDISKIGLHDLRSKLSIIPQDPVLFRGTIRSNIDPFAEYNDKDLWNAIEKSHLHELLINLDGKLDSPVEESGENFSVGQRQLICLARAILKKSKILVMDEATSSVDIETDTLIQKTIREQFKDRTVLTIAHRINTIMDYDKIMVLSEGLVVEFASPKDLLNDKNSVFSSMVNEGSNF